MTPMSLDELLTYFLAKPGAWRDEPWGDGVVAKVETKIFASLRPVEYPARRRASGSNAACAARRPTSG